MDGDRQGAEVLSGMTTGSFPRKGFNSYLNEGKIRASDALVRISRGRRYKYKINAHGKLTLTYRFKIYVLKGEESHMPSPGLLNSRLNLCRRFGGAFCTQLF